MAKPKKKSRTVLIDLCKGCNSKLEENDSIFCRSSSVPNMSNSKLCPCSNCLIKSVCERSCHNFTEYVNKVNQFIIYKNGSSKNGFVTTILKAKGG